LVFGITAHTRVFIRCGATDGRLGYEGLKGIVANAIREDPMCGHLFVFCNAARNRLKLLWWHSGGFYIATKRMRKGGGFEFPRTPNAVSKMTLQQLEALLKGVDFTRPPNKR
jgi:transposase